MYKVFILLRFSDDKNWFPIQNIPTEIKYPTRLLSVTSQKQRKKTKKKNNKQIHKQSIPNHKAIAAHANNSNKSAK